jgi:hypothetical protein
MRVNQESHSPQGGTSLIGNCSSEKRDNYWCDYLLLLANLCQVTIITVLCDSAHALEHVGVLLEALRRLAQGGEQVRHSRSAQALLCAA